MYTYILFGLVVISLIITLNNSKCDFLSPLAIVLEVYAIGLSFLVIEMGNWEASISARTFQLIILGLSMYIIGSLVSKAFFSKLKLYNGKTLSKMEPIEYHKAPQISGIITLFVCIVDVTIFLKYFFDVRNSASSVGNFSDIATMIGLYRTAGVRGELEVRISGISNYGYMLMTVLAYIYLYIIINTTIIERKKVTWYLYNTIPIFLYILCSLLTGGRNPILQFVFAGIMMFYIIHRKIKGKAKEYNKKFLFRVILIACVVVVIFSAIRTAIGRVDDFTLFEYVAIYIGAPIKLFDLFIEYPPVKAKVLWGQETFINIWKWIGSLTDNEFMNSLVMNKEYRSTNGIFLGNVYTAFREYYFDFGIMGIIVLTFIHSVIFNTAYNKIFSANRYIRSKKIDVSIIIYSYISIALVYFSIDDRFYQKFLSRECFIELIMLIVLAYALPKFRIKVLSRNHKL